MFVNVLRKIEIEHSEFQLHKSSRSLFSLAFLSLSFSLPSCSFSSTSVFSLIFLFAFVASSGDRLLISPDGLLSLWDVMESFRCVSRIARRFSILPILLHPLLPHIHSFSLSISFLLPGPPTGPLHLLPPRVSPNIRKCAWAADSAAQTGRIRERMQKMKKKTREGFFYSRNARSNMNMHWLTRNCELLLRGQHCSRLFIISASIV